MSLANFLKDHYFTLQTNEAAGNVKGGINRKEGWVNEAENLNGHLQSVEGKREELRTDYNRVDLEVKWILFHNYQQYDIHTGKRILVMRNPLLVVNFNDKENIRVFKIISRKEPVRRAKTVILYEIYLHEITRQSIL